jgi:hypothetical protein
MGKGPIPDGVPRPSIRIPAGRKLELPGGASAQETGGPAVVVLTFVIGVLNVCLGYAIAVYMGYGPPSLPEAWQALTVQSRIPEPDQATGQAAAGLLDDETAAPGEDSHDNPDGPTHLTC